MNQEQILNNIRTLPPIAQQEVIDFIAFLRVRYADVINLSEENKPLDDLEDEPFIGMWKDRTDMDDSTEWVRQLREREGKRHL